MGLALHPSLTFCETGERLVFLDTVADRYFTVSGTLEMALRALLRGDGVSSAVANRLVDEGLLLRRAGPTSIEPFILADPAKTSFLDEPPCTIRPFEVAHLILRIYRTRRAIQEGRFAALLQSLRLSKTERAIFRSPSPDATHTLASQFARTRHVTRTLDQCLPRSLGLAAHAFDLGIPVDLVIGVRMRPFAAHAWVQSAGKLLTDRIDSTRTYTPIFSI